MSSLLYVYKVRDIDRMTSAKMKCPKYDPSPLYFAFNGEWRVLPRVVSPSRLAEGINGDADDIVVRSISGEDDADNWIAEIAMMKPIMAYMRTGMEAIEYERGAGVFRHGQVYLVLVREQAEEGDID